MGLFSDDSETNPFKTAEETMHHHMKHAKGDSVDETFVRKMVAHHTGALNTGEILLEKGSDPELKQMVEKSMAEQRKEIAELQSWLQKHAMAEEAVPSLAS